MLTQVESLIMLQSRLGLKVWVKRFKPYPCRSSGLRAEHDLVGLHAFLAPVNPHVATLVVSQLAMGAEQLLAYPHFGVQLEDFAPRDVRRLIVGDYELRYELTDTTIYVLRALTRLTGSEMKRSLTKQ